MFRFFSYVTPQELQALGQVMRLCVLFLVGKEQMSDGRPRLRKNQKSFIGFIDSENKYSSINSLSTDGINMLELLTLVIDIAYRNKYGTPVSEHDRNRTMTVNGVLADQLSPVDDLRSARISSTGDNCEYHR